MDKQMPPPRGSEGTASASQSTTTSNKAAEDYTCCRWSSGPPTSTHSAFMGRLQANCDLIDRHGSWWLLDLEYRRRLREGA